MRRLLLILITFTLTQFSAISAPVEILAGMSDIIVKGEVLEIGNKAFRIRVEKYLKGDSKSKAIRIKWGKRLMCSSCEYCLKKGDNFYFFLKKRGTGYKTIDHRNGALKIIDGNLAHHFGCSCNQPSLCDFENSIRQFAWMYEYAGQLNCKNAFKQRVSDTSACKCCYHSDFSDYLMDRMKYYAVIK